jgi:hypothetical protein
MHGNNPSRKHAYKANNTADRPMDRQEQTHTYQYTSSCGTHVISTSLLELRFPETLHILPCAIVWQKLHAGIRHANLANVLARYSEHTRNLRCEHLLRQAHVAVRTLHPPRKLDIVPPLPLIARPKMMLNGLHLHVSLSEQISTIKASFVKLA